MQPKRQSVSCKYEPSRKGTRYVTRGDFFTYVLLLFMVCVAFQETESDFDNCAVCIEGYRPNDVVRILPCR